MEDYTYHVAWSPEEREHMGTCAEFPRLSHFDESRDAALARIVVLVQAVTTDMEETGETIPGTFAKKQDSAREDEWT